MSKRHIPTFEEYVKAHKITQCAGFWYCGPGATWPWDARDYRGVLLARAEDGENPKKMWPKSVTIEIVGYSVRDLARQLRELGFEPPQRLGALCESARVSPKPPHDLKVKEKQND